MVGRLVKPCTSIGLDKKSSIEVLSIEVLDELNSLRSFAKNFEGYDLTDVLKDIIKEEFNLKEK